MKTIAALLIFLFFACTTIAQKPEIIKHSYTTKDTIINGYWITATYTDTKDSTYALVHISHKDEKSYFENISYAGSTKIDGKEYYPVYISLIDTTKDRVLRGRYDLYYNTLKAIEKRYKVKDGCMSIMREGIFTSDSDSLLALVGDNIYQWYHSSPDMYVDRSSSSNAWTTFPILLLIIILAFQSRDRK